MSLLGLAVVLTLGLAGPLLATPRRARIPVVIGEIAAGVLVGRTGLGWLDAGEPVLSFLASAGFALVMLVAGSHVPLRDAAMRIALRRGALLAGCVGVLAVPVGFGAAWLAGTGHGPLYAVLLGSSSAALVMPVLDETRARTPAAMALIVQVAIADTAAIVLLSLAEERGRVGMAVIGVLAVVGVGCAGFLVARQLAAWGVLERMRILSMQRNFGLELRLELISLFGLAGVAQVFGVSVMLAGFVTGLALAAQGEPRRLARQLFAVGDGFLAPVFFVWLGASVDLRAVVGQPRMIALATVLAVAAIAVHATAWLLGQPLALAVLAAAQLGVPIAAVTIGIHDHILLPGEDGAILTAAVVTVAVTALASRALRTAEQRR